MTHHHRYKVPLDMPAPVGRVFAALTDTSALRRWFAEFAEVEPRQGGAYRFWGRHTLETRHAPSATQAITAFEPNTQLSFSWPIFGLTSEVTFSLVPSGDAQTSLTIEHRLERLPEGARMAALIDDHWRLVSCNLYLYLTGSDDIHLPDYDNPHPEIDDEIMIDAPASAVFAALIEPDKIKQWFPAPAPIVEPRLGGAYGFGMSYELDGKKITVPNMRILTFEPDRCLAISWPDWRGDPSVPDQTVTFTLEALGPNRTRLRLVHSGFVRTVDVSDYTIGWTPVLEGISRAARGEVGPPPPSC